MTMTPLIRYFVQFLLLLSLLPSISGRALVRRDNFASAAKALDDVDGTLRNYLTSYQGPNSDQLSQQSSFTPEFDLPWTSAYALTASKQIHDGFTAVSSSLPDDQKSSIGELPSNPGICADSFVLSDLSNQEQLKATVAKVDSTETGNIIVLATTHGYWILQISKTFGEDFVTDFNNWLKDNGIRSTARLGNSQFFNERISQTYLYNNHPDSLSSFVSRIAGLQGQATGLWLLSKSTSVLQANDAPVAKRLLTAVSDKIQTAAKSITRDQLPIYNTVWNIGRDPWKQLQAKPQVMYLTIAFFYSQNYGSWEMVSLFGPQLGLFTLNDGSNSDSDEDSNGDPMDCISEISDAEEDETFNEAQQVSDSGSSPGMNRVRWDSIQSDSLLGFLNPITDDKLGLGVVVLTSLGYWAVLYTPNDLNVAPEQTSGEIHIPGHSKVMADLDDAMQKQLKDATGFSINTLVPVDGTGYVEWGTYLDDLLLSVRDKTAPWFSGKAPTTSSLIPAVPPRSDEGDEKRQLILSAKLANDEAQSQATVNFQFIYGERIWLQETLSTTGERTTINSMATGDIGALKGSFFLYPELDPIWQHGSD
ncbi:uncharacterized protein N7459_009660 [Penicillium hispanicum]|uniref:uncharacterized protein n=1 Tax=Penicillium hispanicum TaxID=1080232 RepID=UPI0025418820|nr:uncharacterized protein N7459_009660 [Penicillium hispanicum]KAJ5570230.1 hypothetical protein N7459_009660 [Penicillium hispanicum]